MNGSYDKEKQSLLLRQLHEWSSNPSTLIMQVLRKREKMRVADQDAERHVMQETERRMMEVERMAVAGWYGAQWTEWWTAPDWQERQQDQWTYLTLACERST
jgi:hypothetical protein